MNKSSATIMAAALMLASSCTDIKQEGQGYEPIIGKQEITIKDGRLTPEALWAMGPREILYLSTICNANAVNKVVLPLS